MMTLVGMRQAMPVSKRWVALQIEQELRTFRFDMDIERGRRQVKQNGPATEETLDSPWKRLGTCFLTITA